MLKDKIILVFYLDTTDIPRGDENEYIKNASEALNYLKDDSVMLVIVPVEGQETRLECINPVLLNEEQYAQVQEKIDGFQKALDEFAEQAKEKKNG